MMKEEFRKYIFFILTSITVLEVFIITLSGCSSKRNDNIQIIGFPQSFADLSEEVKPAVVNISTITTVVVPGHPFRQFFGHEEDRFGDFLRRFFGDIPDRELRQQSLGSGFIIDKDGHIITNNHVVEMADEINVRLADGREYKAKVIGRDPKTDLALIKISSLFKSLPVLSIGDSESMRVGDWVLAVGNPFGLEHTVTQGIISATGRVIGVGPYDNFLQTVTPEVADFFQLKEPKGVLVGDVVPGGPADNAGIKRGDIIVSFAGKRMNDVPELSRVVAEVPVGRGVDLKILRDGKEITSTVRVEELEEQKMLSKLQPPELKLGMEVDTISRRWQMEFGIKITSGVVVVDIVPNSPADLAGMQVGDVITEINRKSVGDVNDYKSILEQVKRGDSILFLVNRGGQTFYVSIKVS